MILPKRILHNAFSNMSYQAFKASHDPADDHETISISGHCLNLIMIITISGITTMGSDRENPGAPNPNVPNGGPQA